MRIQGIKKIHEQDKAAKLIHSRLTVEQVEILITSYEKIIEAAKNDYRKCREELTALREDLHEVW